MINRDLEQYLDAVPQHIREDAGQRLKRLQVDLTALDPDPSKLIEDCCLYHFVHGDEELDAMFLEEFENYNLLDLMIPVSSLEPKFSEDRFLRLIDEGVASRLKSVQEVYVLTRIKYLRFLSNPTSHLLEDFMEASFRHVTDYAHGSTASNWPIELVLLEKGFPYKSVSKDFVKAITQWFLLGHNCRRSVFELGGSKEEIARLKGINPGALEDATDWVPKSFLEHSELTKSASDKKSLDIPNKLWEEDVYWDEWMPKFLDAWDAIIQEYVNYIGRRS